MRRVQSAERRKRDAPAGARRTDDDAVVLGRRIREVRLESRLSLREIADQAGVSVSLLSQVERGLASPSMSSLRRIADALGVRVATLFGEEARPAEGMPVVIRRNERKSLSLAASNVRYELLTPELSSGLLLTRIEFEPGESDAEAPSNVHSGTESAICLNGEIVFSIADHEYELKAGDAISFNPALPHYAINRSHARAVVITATVSGASPRE